MSIKDGEAEVGQLGQHQQPWGHKPEADDPKQSHDHLQEQQKLGDLDAESRLSESARGLNRLLSSWYSKTLRKRSVEEGTQEGLSQPLDEQDRPMSPSSSLAMFIPVHSPPRTDTNSSHGSSISRAATRSMTSNSATSDGTGITDTNSSRRSWCGSVSCEHPPMMESPVSSRKNTFEERYWHRARSLPVHPNRSRAVPSGGSGEGEANGRTSVHRVPRTESTAATLYHNPTFPIYEHGWARIARITTPDLLETRDRGDKPNVNIAEDVPAVTDVEDVMEEGGDTKTPTKPADIDPIRVEALQPSEPCTPQRRHSPDRPTDKEDHASGSEETPSSSDSDPDSDPGDPTPGCDDDDGCQDKLFVAVHNAIMEHVVLGDLDELEAPLREEALLCVERVSNLVHSRNSQTSRLPRFIQCSGEQLSGSGSGSQQPKADGSRGSDEQQQKQQQQKKRRKKRSGSKGRSDDEGSSGDSDNDSDPDDDRQGQGPKKRPKPDHHDSGGFSCPFRKRNPLRFNVRTATNCATQSFADLPRLKRHIRIYHKRSEATRHECFRCHNPFKTFEDLVKHLSLPTEQMCGLTVSTASGSFGVDPEDGIGPKVESELIKRKCSINNWDKLWELLFPTDDKIGSWEFEPPVELHEVKKGFDDESGKGTLFRQLLDQGVIHDSATMIVEIAEDFVGCTIRQCQHQYQVEQPVSFNGGGKKNGRPDNSGSSRPQAKAQRRPDQDNGEHKVNGNGIGGGVVPIAPAPMGPPPPTVLAAAATSESRMPWLGHQPQRGTHVLLDGFYPAGAMPRRRQPAPQPPQIVPGVNPQERPQYYENSDSAISLTTPHVNPAGDGNGDCDFLTQPQQQIGIGGVENTDRTPSFGGQGNNSFDDFDPTDFLSQQHDFNGGGLVPMDGMMHNGSGGGFSDDDFAVLRSVDNFGFLQEQQPEQMLQSMHTNREAMNDGDGMQMRNGAAAVPNGPNSNGYEVGAGGTDNSGSI